MPRPLLLWGGGYKPRFTEELCSTLRSARTEIPGFGPSVLHDLKSAGGSFPPIELATSEFDDNIVYSSDEQKVAKKTRGSLCGRNRIVQSFRLTFARLHVLRAP
jgi:hypothetical protein